MLVRVDGPYRVAEVPRQRCPRCADTGLIARAVGHVAVDECPGCHGVFVTTAVLDAIVEDLALYEEVRRGFPAGPTRAEQPGPMYVPCPTCREIMNRRQFAPGAGVVVDVCRAHGMWFDACELPAVVDFIERRGPEAMRAPAPAPRPVAAPPSLASALTEPITSRRRDSLAAAVIELLLFWV